MTNPSIEQIMHDVLDGVADAQTRAQLEARLAAEPELRERYQALEHMFETLNRIPMHDAPADLHAGLMRRINTESRSPRIPGWVASLSGAFRARPVPAFAMAVVTIAALALVLWTGLQQRAPLLPDATLPVTGTLAPPAPAAVATLKSGDARITLRILRDAGMLSVRIEGEAPAGASLELGADANDIATPDLEGTGAQLTAAGIETGRAQIQLNGHVQAQLHFGAWPESAERINATLVTPAGRTHRTLTTGPDGSSH